MTYCDLSVLGPRIQDVTRSNFKVQGLLFEMTNIQGFYYSVEEVD